MFFRVGIEADVCVCRCVCYTAVSFKPGDRIEARWKRGSLWYPGRVGTVNADGTYAVEYDDGDREPRVGPELVRALAEVRMGAC